MQALVQQLHQLCDAQPYHVGWYLKNLRSGAVAQRHGDVVVPSASTRKIAILMAALKAVHEGKLALQQPLTLEARYQDNDSGVCQHLQPGLTLSLRDALVLMIIVSDNTCTGTLVDLLGLEYINAFCRAIGMRGTTHRHGIPPRLPRDHAVEATNATTPADVGLLLDLMLQGTRDAEVAARLGCTPALCQLALDILSWQKLSWRLPALLPYGTKVAHKTGRGQQGRNNNDAGIVYLDGEPLFILSVFTEHVPPLLPDGTPGYTAAGHLIARLCRLCYDALKD
ncbi:MAG: serine hydrolase [Candidatus Tectimicrobiota bacterium]|nr:MAG: serine hydrolase [Candidatus Tectomicrobia bacterium]